MKEGVDVRMKIATRQKEIEEKHMVVAYEMW
jgi:hypothetical protein